MQNPGTYSPGGAADRTPIDPAIVQRAALWLARLWSGQASPADNAACAAWRAAHPDHERAFLRLQGVEGRLASVPADAARGVLLDLPARQAAGRRRALGLLGLALFSGTGSVYVLRETSAWQGSLADYRSGVGETRELTLPDGTRVVLDTDSAFDLSYTATERRLILRTGSILIESAHDAAVPPRSLLVQTREGTVRALGTRFTVRQDEGLSRVAVFQGAVELRPVQGDGVLRLDAGQGASFSAQESAGITAVEESAAAWTHGTLVAERTRLADFLAEVGRYRRGILRCDPAVADLRVTGVFSLRDTDRALANLALGLPVDITYRTRWWASVGPRPS